MRDPKRIGKFCDELKAIWRCVPDWRFGQLMSNMLGAYVQEAKRDIFFPEDDELIEFFKKYIGENVPELGGKKLSVCKVWVVTYCNNGDEPVVTVFDNEGAAKYMYSVFIGAYDKVCIDQVAVHHAFKVV